jgi:hypothetical protein
MRAKRPVQSALLTFAAGSSAAGDKHRDGAPEDGWSGNPNRHESRRALTEKYPETPTPGVMPDEQGVFVECNDDDR